MRGGGYREQASKGFHESGEGKEQEQILQTQGFLGRGEGLMRMRMGGKGSCGRNLSVVWEKIFGHKNPERAI